MAIKARNIYMVGIGGIGMSALAQYFIEQGCSIAGSDRDDSPVISMLAEKGIAVTIGHDQCLIPAHTELLIYSDAIPSSNIERERAREMGIPELSYFEALGEVSRETRLIAVAGTHGKTTTTAMLTKILQVAGEAPTAIVGSIVRDLNNSNFLAGRSDLFVIEACEYRDHFLKLSPEILVITNIELDHTDYFPDLEAVQKTFRTAIERVPSHGVIVTNPQNPNIAPLLPLSRARIVDYTTMTIGELHVLGEFNRDNARAALAAAHAAFPELSLSRGTQTLSEFRGAWRRFEYRGETPLGALVYDDYAHHPTAIEKTIRATREEFPGKRIVVAFHPHLYSRTRSFMNEFARALTFADRAIIAPIYAAREDDDETVSSEILAEHVRSAGGTADAFDSLDLIRDELLKEGSDTLIITMGAGDIYKVAEQIAD